MTFYQIIFQSSKLNITTSPSLYSIDDFIEEIYMKRILKNPEHMSRINYLDNFIEENYGQMKIEKN